jgi:NAD(P)-dependent dehydrogenase (short-subunit alcohol dehydrogenase family)
MVPGKQGEEGSVTSRLHFSIQMPMAESLASQRCLEGKVAVVTGAGRGIGRAEALRLAAEGAAVVVNDVGASLLGESSDTTPAEKVAREIRGLGGQAVANSGDVASWKDGQALIAQALSTFGRLDVLVANAGNSRPRMAFNMSEEDWDVVTQVHLKGTFVPIRFASAHWRDVSKASGKPTGAAVVLTTSVNGLRGSPGHLNYAAAKAGVAAMNTVLAAELAPYGVRVNCVAPLAFTRMTEELHGGPLFSEERRVDLGPDNVAEVVTWLASPYAADITGHVVNFAGRRLEVYAGWHPVTAAETDSTWTLSALDDAKALLFPENPAPTA